MRGLHLTCNPPSISEYLRAGASWWGNLAVPEGACRKPSPPEKDHLRTARHSPHRPTPARYLNRFDEPKTAPAAGVLPPCKDNFLRQESLRQARRSSCPVQGCASLTDQRLLSAVQILRQGVFKDHENDRASFGGCRSQLAMHMPEALG